MRRRKLPYAAGALMALGLWACEDGPEQIFEPNKGDPVEQNGHAATTPWFQSGDKGYDSREGTEDQVGRARFCSEEENERLIQWMVTQPIVPDVSVGGVPMWSADGTPVYADDLLGKPADFSSPDKFCDPTEYSNAFTWGPTDEVIYFINQSTRLVEFAVAYTQYLGNMDGEYTRRNEDGSTEKVPVKIHIRERLTIGDEVLDQYSSRAEQETKPRAWTNVANVNAIYRMIRETYFGARPEEIDEDCVATKICNIIYTSEEAQGTPQIVVLYFLDSGVQLQMAPDGYLTLVVLEPVRVAPFETETTVRLGEEGTSNFDATLESISKPSCTLRVADLMSWGEFKQRCIGDDDRILDRIAYSVGGQRDTVTLDFQRVTLSFLRDIAERPLLKDGERPDDADQLYRLIFNRQAQAPLAEFVPKRLAEAYRERLLARLRAAVTVPTGSKGGQVDGGLEPEPEDAGVVEPDAAAPVDAGVVEPDAGGADAAEVDAGPDAAEPPPEEDLHPFLTFDIEVPDTLPDEPRPIDKLAYGPNLALNFNNTVIAEVRALYDSLTPEERAAVDPRVIDPTWLIEPYIEVVLEAFSHGQVNGRFAFEGILIPDDRNFVVGLASFIQNDVPYRLEVHYSMSYGEVSAVVVSAGYARLDTLLNKWNLRLRQPEGLGQPRYPYYSMDLARAAGNPFGIGGDGVRVLDFDRRLDTLDIQVVDVDDEGNRVLRDLTVNGIPIQDGNGYFRQIRGERYEFVPANVINLSGRETSLIVWVEAGNRIGRASGSLKRPVELCPGLSIGYGDDVRERVDQWAAERGFNAYRECDIAFNYSANGNVLDEVASLTHRVAFTTSNGRAVSVAMWR